MARALTPMLATMKDVYKRQILGEDKMLTTLCQVKEDTSEEWYMAEVDFDTGTIRRRLDFEGASAVQLTGACARGPILILREPEKERRLCLYDVEQDALEPIPFDIEDETWCLDDTSGTIYCLEGDVYKRQPHPRPLFLHAGGTVHRPV